MRLIPVIITLFLSTGCAARMMTPRQAADAGLVSHPELSDVNDRLRRVEEMLDTIRERTATLDERIANLSGVARDLAEHEEELLKKLMDDLRAELKKKP